MNELPSIARQQALLRLEYEHEREEFRRLTQAMGIGRRVKRGDCWWPVVTGRSYYNSLNQPVIELYRSSDEAEVEHNFEYGRSVAFFTVSATDDITYFNITATVSYAENLRMVVVVPEGVASQLSTADRLGVTLSFDETTHRLMQDALQRVASARGNRLAQLRDIFYHKAPSATLSFAPLRFPWLNATQEQAVNAVLRAKDVAVVHGPPGTGKTTTLVEAIHETLHRESQVLVCAQSNMAVDWISERLQERGVEVLRVGNPTRVTDKMLSQTYERRFEAHPDYPQLWSLRKALREVRSRKHRGSENYHQQVERLRNRITELEVRIHSEIMGQARVIACTLAGSANRVLEGMRFGTLFIDEAAQALEAACWIAIGKAHRVILAGDHCQLPPTVKCVEALHGGLGVTLMERIVAGNPQVVTLLGVQYRMNDDIMRFSSEWFYGGKVESAPEVRYRSILDWETPITWIDTADLDGHEEMVGDGYGRINRAEAQLTLDTLKAYVERIGQQRMAEEHIDVAIISPYRAQVQHLRRLVRHCDALKPLRNSIAVNTVDGFQGQERDIVIISLVRANDEGQIGFLRDLRRMNVAITRARCKLIILGSVATLTKHTFYRRLHRYIQSLEEG